MGTGASMADEIARRMEADGGLDPAGGPAPGTDGASPPTPDQPPAGASNTDTSGQGGTPDSIPYARFKEVNDQLATLKDYGQLRDLGYDPDSLGRLAAFEAEYTRDPKGTLGALVADLDLPDDRKAELTRLLSDDSGDGSAGAGDESRGEGAEKPPSPEVQELLEWKRAKEAEDREKSDAELLNSIVSLWNDADKASGITMPTEPEAQQSVERQRLMYVSHAARLGGWKTAEELQQRAREMWLADRELTLGSAVRSSRRSGGPLSVPSGGPPGAEIPKFADLRDASKAAEADIRAGRLPGLNR